MSEAASDLLGRLSEVDGVVVVAFKGLGDAEEFDVGGTESVYAAFEVEVLLREFGDIVLLGLARLFADGLAEGGEALGEGFPGRVEVDLLRRALNGRRCLARDRLELGRE